MEVPTSAQSSDQFFATISRFKSQDFNESSNQEMLMIKSLIEQEFDPLDAHPGLPNFEMRANQQQHHFGIHDQGNMAPSPVSLYPFVSMYAAPSSSQGQVSQAQQSHQSFGSFLPQGQQMQFPSNFQRQQSIVPGTFFSSTTANQQGRPTQFSTQMQVPSVSPPALAKRIKFAPEIVEHRPSQDGDGERLRKRPIPSKAKSEEEETTTLPDSDNEALANGDGSAFTASIQGETRLNIKFINKGTVGAIPQKFGKGKCLIPDGLSGTHQMYEQRWKFEIKHEIQSGNQVLIRWTIHNLSSNQTTSVLETAQDAINRDGCGRTICNNVLRKALDARLVELEGELKHIEATNPSRAQNMRNLMKHLKPKRCTVGLLFFGLLHREIQVLMDQQRTTLLAAQPAPQ